MEEENQEGQQVAQEELLQEIEQLKARLEQFDKMDLRLVTDKSIYLKISLVIWSKKNGRPKVLNLASYGSKQETQKTPQRGRPAVRREL